MILFFRTPSKSVIATEIDHKPSQDEINNFLLAHSFIKFILFLIILFYRFDVFHAQNNLTKDANTPIASDILIGNAIDNIAISSNANIRVWNLRDTNIRSQNTKIYFGEEDSVNSMPILIGKTIYHIENIKKDTLQITCYENNLEKGTYTKPEIAMPFPFHYGDSICKYFHGIGTYCDKRRFYFFGKYSISADAEGILLLPNGEQLNNILQVHKRKQISTKWHSIDIPLFSIQELTEDNIEHYLQADSTCLYQPQIRNFRG